MGSKSNSIVKNTDNRLGLTDDAIGVAGGSKLAYGGNIFDFSTQASVPGTGSISLGSSYGSTGGRGSGGANGNGIGGSAAGGGVSIDVLDGGAIAQAFEFAGNAIDAVAGEGFQNLLSTMTAQQDTALAQLDAIRSATNDKEGKLDQKTIIILGAIGLAFMYFMSRRK